MLSTQKNKRNFSTIYESALHRDITAIVGYQARKVRRLIRNFRATTLDVTTARYCCWRPNSHADVTDETVTTPLVDHRSVPPAQTVALRRFQNHGTPFTWDKTPRQSATSRFHEHTCMSSRPSYVLHMRIRCVPTPTTVRDNSDATILIKSSEIAVSAHLRSEYGPKYQ